MLGDNAGEINGGGRDLGMTTALYVARVIHTDLTMANAASWQWWLALSANNYKDGLIYLENEGKMGENAKKPARWRCTCLKNHVGAG